MLYSSQNTGIEKASTAKIMEDLSIQVFCFQAASTPRGTATTIDRNMARKPIESVGSKRRMIWSATGTFDAGEMPRSPWSALVSQTINCSYIGLSSPKLARICAMVSGVPESPASMIAGSPGTMWTREKVNTATMSSTGSIATMRWAMYSFKGCFLAASVEVGVAPRSIPPSR